MCDLPHAVGIRSFNRVPLQFSIVFEQTTPSLSMRSVTMKNAKLSSKLLFLTIVLLSITVLIAWVGVSRLGVLDASVQQLGGQTLQNAISAGEIRTKLLMAIRAQKNAIMSPTDEESRRKADASRKYMTEVSQELRTLAASVVDAKEKSMLDSFEEAFLELRKVNDECLELAVQNTNLKGAAELFGKTTTPTRRTLDTLRTIEAAFRAIEPPTPANEANAASTKAFADDLQELTRTAAQHLSISASDSNFSEIDQRFKELLEQLPKNAEKTQEACRTANVASGDLSSSVSTVRSGLAEVLRLSTLDTNNNPQTISLTTAKERAETAIERIFELIGSLKATAESDVTASKATYDQGRLYIFVACYCRTCAGLRCSRSGFPDRSPHRFPWCGM